MILFSLKVGIVLKSNLPKSSVTLAVARTISLKKYFSPMKKKELDASPTGLHVNESATQLAVLRGFAFDPCKCKVFDLGCFVVRLMCL